MVICTSGCAVSQAEKSPTQENAAVSAKVAETTLLNLAINKTSKPRQAVYNYFTFYFAIRQAVFIEFLKFYTINTRARKDKTETL